MQSNHVYGPELVKLREKANLTQRQVADALKLTTPQFISNWERGRAKVPLATLPNLAMVYGVPPTALTKLVLRDFNRSLDVLAKVKPDEKLAKRLKKVRKQ